MLEFLKNLLLADTHPSQLRPTASEPPIESVEPGTIHHGTVRYVGPAFAKIDSERFTGFLRISEMAPHRIEAASEVLAAGESVEFVVLEPSTKTPGEWIVSLAAVPEVKRRAHLARLTRGQRLPAEVVRLLDKGVVLDAGGVELFAPLSELSWEAVSHPAYAVSLGQKVDVEVTHISIPDWSAQWRQVRSKATVSLKKCKARPSSTLVSMAFSGIPFRLVALARRPPQLDSLVLHVLAELVEGFAVEEIAQRTRLPLATLGAILKLLSEEGYAMNYAPTQRGRNLIEADKLAQRINDARFGGVACNAAEQSVRFMNRDGRVPNPPYPADSLIPAYPSSWPRPAFDARADQQFFRLSGDSIPEGVLTMLLDEEEQALLVTLHGDRRLHLTLRPDGPSKEVCTYVSDHWVYAGLWAAFDALGDRKPYRPKPGVARATSLLLVRLQPFDADGRLLKSVYFEPYSQTLWQPRDANLARLREQTSASFPDLPTLAPDGLRLTDGTVAVRLQTAAWSSVLIKGAP